MLLVAHVTLPGHMPPTLARACGELLSAPDIPGMADFISLTLMHQSWHIGQPTGLGMYLNRMRECFSYTNVLGFLGAPDVYEKAVMQDDIARARALSAINASRNLAALLEDADLESLKATTLTYLHRLLNQPTMDQGAPGRDLAMALHEQVSMYNPELSRANSSVVGLLGKPKQNPQQKGDSVQSGMIELKLTIAGKEIGTFTDPEAAAAAAEKALLSAGVREDRLALSPEPSSTKGPAIKPGTPTLKVFDPAAVVARLKKMPSSSSVLEGNSQQLQLLNSMAEDHGIRVLSEVPGGTPLASLYASFPHFTEVLDFIAKRLVLAGCGDEGRPVRLPPLLLRGDAGVGKTYFAQELARVLGTNFLERDLSVTSEAFVISGMDSSWKGSKPGIVFDALVNGPTANPVILLNEIDKAQARGTNNSPISALYALMEYTSASRFVDEYVPIEIDASRVIWICTANEGYIPGPIQSRLEVFDIRQPTAEECRQIAVSVWKSVCARELPHGHGFDDELAPIVQEVISRLNPRDMRKALTDAACTAVMDKRRFLLPADIDLTEARYKPVTEKMAIGFVQ